MCLICKVIMCAAVAALFFMTCREGVKVFKQLQITDFED